MESAQQILGYQGNSGLAFGTAGSNATAAPIGVLDFGNNRGFDQLAQYTFLKNKQQYDAKKKEADDMYNSFKEIDLSTDKILDVDRQVLLGDVKKVTDYLTAHPHALTPKTPEQVKENIEAKKLIDDFKSNKAKAQVRYVLKPETDKAIAENLVDREDMKTHYDQYFNKPLEYVTPYQKHYDFDWKKLAGEAEAKDVESYSKDGVYKLSDAYSSNLNTTRNKVIAKLNEGDKAFNGYITSRYNSYIEANNKVALEKQALINAGKVDEANKLQPFLTPEINSANNYIREYNAIHPDTAIPEFDPTKPLDKTQYALLQGIVTNVQQNKSSKGKDLSDLYKLRLSLGSKGSGTALASQDYLVSAVVPFLPQQSEEAKMYEAGISGQEGYIVNDKGVAEGMLGKFRNTDKGIFYNNQKYNNIKSVTNIETGRTFAKIGDDLIEYTGNSWEKVEAPPIAIDDKIIRALGGQDHKAELVGNKLKITYKKGTGENEKEFTVYKSRETYLKDILESNQKGWNETRNDLEAYGIYNLDNDADFIKAVELANTGKLSGGKPSKEAPAKQYTFKGKTYTYDQVKAAAEKSGVSVDEYIKKVGLK